MLSASGVDLRDPTTVAILEAGEWAFAHLGLRKATMNAIAERAGVGVATVYRRFPRRQQILDAVIELETQRLIDAVDRAFVDAAGEPEEQVVAGWVAYVRELYRRPVLTSLAIEEATATAQRLDPNGQAVLSMSQRYIARAIKNLQQTGQLAAFDADLVAEIFARLAYSIALTPGLIPVDDEQGAAEFASAYLTPLLSPRLKA